MRLGIMQPYFFPYLGHFALIANTDRWVVFDISQYTPKSWMTRNRILHPSQGWSYVSVPLANGSIAIKTFEAQVLDSVAAAVSLKGKLSHYRRFAPYYSEVVALVSRVFAEPTSSLVDLNLRGLRASCAYLDIPFDPVVASRADFDLPQIDHPGGWALEISRRMGATHYINPESGRNLFVQADFANAGIELRFLTYDGYSYPTAPLSFEPGLSILDVMMWNDPASIRHAIKLSARVTD